MKPYSIFPCLFLLAFSSSSSATPLDTDITWGSPAYHVDPETSEWVPTQGGFFWHSANSGGYSLGNYNWATYPTRILKLSDGKYIVSGQAKEFNSATYQFIEKFDSNGNPLAFHFLKNSPLFINSGVLTDGTYSGSSPPAAGPLETGLETILWGVLKGDGYPPGRAYFYNLSLDLSAVNGTFEYSSARTGGSYLSPYSIGSAGFDGKFLDLGLKNSVYIYVQTAPKGIARLNLNGTFDAGFSGDGFLDFTTLTGTVFGKALSDGSLVVVGDNKILRIRNDGTLMSSTGNGSFFSVSDSPLSSLTELIVHDVIELGDKLRFLGSYYRQFANGARQQVVTFDLDKKGDPTQENGFFYKQVTLLNTNENISRAMFDARANIALCHNGKVALIDCLSNITFENFLNDGAYRSVNNFQPNISYLMYDIVFELNRMLVLNGPVVQALKYPTDSDRDGLWNSVEMSIGTDPFKVDSDEDGLSDWEDKIKWGLDPLDDDSDNDGVGDGDEVLAPDSDGDGLIDGVETNTGVFISKLNTGTDPNKVDSDGDGLGDSFEVTKLGTDPNKEDSDNDGFSDSFEVNTGFDPTLGTSTPDTLSSIRTAVEFRFNAANGVSYRIEASTDLNEWGTIETNIIGASAVVTRFYSTENQPRRYFRARRN
jgi:hypothetical protein